MRIRFSLKRRHIRKGIKNSHNKCPVALVIREAFPLSIVYVMPDHFWLNKDDAVYFPRSVRRFITTFDMRGKKYCKPLNFIVNIHE